MFSLLLTEVHRSSLGYLYRNYLFKVFSVERLKGTFCQEARSLISRKVKQKDAISLVK